MALRDRTINDVVASLKDPVEYVRRVFDNMRGYHRDCQVRLALDRKSNPPDYIIDMLIYDEIDGQEAIIPQSIAVFSGRTHNCEEDPEKNMNRLWSETAMTWIEVQALLGKLRQQQS